MDALIIGLWDAGLPAVQGAGCPNPGDLVAVAGLVAWGDVDCSGEANLIDALKIMLADAGLTVTQQAGCPEPGAAVTVTGS